MEHTACIGQPFAELIFQFVVVVSLANSELGGSPLNARAPPFPDFLQGVFWLNKEGGDPSLSNVPHHEHALGFGPACQVDEVA